MNRVWWPGTQPAGVAGETSTGGLGPEPSRTGQRRGCPGSEPGTSAAATAAGLAEVWSSIRLLITRGCESTTEPVFCW